MKELKQLAKNIYEILSPEGKKFFILVTIFSAVVSFFDALSVSLMAPFVAIASDFDFIHQSETASKIYQYFGFDSEAKFIVMLGVIVFIAYVIRSALSILNIYFISRFSIGRYFDLSTRLFNNYLHHSLVHYSKRNSSDMTRAVISETNQLIQLFSGLLTMATEIFVFILLYSIMLYVNYQVTLVLTILLVTFGLILTLSVSGRIKKQSVVRVESGKKQFRILSSAFGNFRILKLLSMEDVSMSGYGEACSKMSYSYRLMNVLQSIPRLGLEMVGFGIMVVGLTSYIYTQGSSIKPLIPLFALFALGMYRMLPSINRVLTSYNQILAASESLRVVHKELNEPKETVGKEELPFNDRIELKNIQFSYEPGKPVLENINLTIEKGSRVVLIGESGQGKSTLVDLIIGLLYQSEGELNIDGTPLTMENMRSWRTKIGYIPQTVYLFDASVKDNVLLGRKYDKDRLEKVLSQANILDFLNTKEGIHTMVGDAGLMLSGGQRQRIAIARALYGDPELLVLDEATSALDVSTESKILSELKKVDLDTTILTVTHRTESITEDQVVYCVENGTLKSVS